MWLSNFDYARIGEGSGEGIGGRSRYDDLLWRVDLQMRLRMSCFACCLSRLLVALTGLAVGADFR